MRGRYLIALDNYNWRHRLFKIAACIFAIQESVYISRTLTTLPLMSNLSVGSDIAGLPA